MDAPYVDQFDAVVLVRWLGLLVPLAVAFITKRYASSRVKAVANVVVTAFVSTIGYLVAKDGGYDVEGFVNSFFNTFVVSIAAYYGFLKPSGIAGGVAEATRNFGVGSRTTSMESRLARSGEGIVGDDHH